MRYAGRPGLPPAVAMLIAERRIRPTSRVLDVGCGDGADLLLLAGWGCRNLVGIDPDPAAIRLARSRATRNQMASRIRYEAADPETAIGVLGERRFDVALHTLVANNLTSGEARHYAAVARLLKPDGLLVLHERLNRDWENAGPGLLAPPQGLARHFELTRSVATHLAEQRTGPRSRGHTPVGLWMGRPRPT